MDTPETQILPAAAEQSETHAGVPDFDLNSQGSKPSGKKSSNIRQRKFKHFKKLPPELQNKIWGQAIDDIEDRVITVVAFTYTPLSLRQLDSCFLPRVRAICNVPALLRTCKNSRSLALKQYEPALHAVIHENGYIYMNFSKDSLHMPGNRYVSELFTEHPVRTLHYILKRQQCSCVTPDYPATRAQLYNSVRTLTVSHMYFHEDSLNDLAKFSRLEKVIYPKARYIHDSNYPPQVCKEIKQRFVKERRTAAENEVANGADLENAFMLKEENVCPMTNGKIKKTTNWPKRKNARPRGPDPLMQ